MQLDETRSFGVIFGIHDVMKDGKFEGRAHYVQDERYFDAEKELIGEMTHGEKVREGLARKKALEPTARGGVNDVEHS
jgi:hypothetical protein